MHEDAGRGRSCPYLAHHAGIPLLVLGNKNDLPGALSANALMERMGLKVSAVPRCHAILAQGCLGALADLLLAEADCRCSPPPCPPPPYLPFLLELTCHARC